MDRFTEKFKDGRNILRKGIDDIFHVGFGRFFEGDSVDKLAEYEDLEEQGKLLKLPCAVGDTVYVLRIDNSAYMMNNEKVWEIAEDKFEIFHFDSIGKTVFLTKESAEAALEEMSKE